jgi:hypothetical protein
MLRAGQDWFSGVDGRIYALMTARDLYQLPLDDRMRRCLIVKKWWGAAPLNRDIRWCVMTREFWAAMRGRARKYRWRWIHERLLFKLKDRDTPWQK